MCFSGDCEMLGQYTEGDLLETYMEYELWASYENGFEEIRHQTQLTDDQRSELLEYLAEFSDHETEFDTHECNRTEWESLAGDHSRSGFFKDHKMDFKRLFGLYWRSAHAARRCQTKQKYGDCVMITHTRTSCPAYHLRAKMPSSIIRTTMEGTRATG